MEFIQNNEQKIQPTFFQ